MRQEFRVLCHLGMGQRVEEVMSGEPLELLVKLRHWIWKNRGRGEHLLLDYLLLWLAWQVSGCAYRS